jgi:uncharacterized protein (TIGR00725 family)
VKRRPLIAVIGDGHLPEGHPRPDLAHRMGALIVGAGWRLLTGGMGGVMAAASAGGRSATSWWDGAIVGVLPTHDPNAANPHVDIVLATGLGHARNTLVAQSDAVVAIGGGAGTLSEMALAWVHGRLVVGLRCGGWSERLADQPIDDTARVPGFDADRVFGVSTPEEAIGVLRELTALYRPELGGRLEP